ncbi:hypothetical protein J2W14_003080 [Pseudarthrobacter oxydans]|nr:hypothetical protein [Pseudarthrobacter oxydans]
MPILVAQDWTCPPAGSAAPAGHAPPRPQPPDIRPLCPSSWPKTGHVLPLAPRARLDMPRPGRNRWTYAHCAHPPGPRLDMSSRWLRGHGWTCPRWPQPLDIRPLCPSSWPKTGHVLPLAPRARLQIPRCGRLDRGNWPFGSPGRSIGPLRSTTPRLASSARRATTSSASMGNCIRNRAPRGSHLCGADMQGDGADPVASYKVALVPSPRTPRPPAQKRPPLCSVLLTRLV